MFKTLREKSLNCQVALMTKAGEKINKVKNFKDDTNGAEVIEYIGLILGAAILVVLLAKFLNKNGDSAFQSIWEKGTSAITGVQMPG